MGKAYFNTSLPELNRVLNEIVEAMGEEAFESLVDKFGNTPLGELCPVFDESLFGDPEPSLLVEDGPSEPIPGTQMVFAFQPELATRQPGVVVCVAPAMLHDVSLSAALSYLPDASFLASLDRPWQDSPAVTVVNTPDTWVSQPPAGAEIPEALRKAA